MLSATGASSGSPATGLVGSRAHRTRVLARLAVAGIGSSILIMIAMTAVRDSWMYPPIAGAGSAPPWDLRIAGGSPRGATVALWLAVLVCFGGGGARLLSL